MQFIQELGLYVKQEYEKQLMKLVQLEGNQL